tara:strand:- start:366 stop:1490 length:1125 start_codon:yes stop_codon:yes gene_type:complete
MSELIAKYKNQLNSGIAKSEIAKNMANSHPEFTRQDFLKLLMGSLEMKKTQANTYYYKYLRPILFDSETITEMPEKATKPKKHASKKKVRQTKPIEISFQNKAEFIDIVSVSKFIDVLSELIEGKNFSHHYKNWSCDSLPDAKRKYSWHGDYQSNKVHLDKLSLGLKAAIKSRDEGQALYWCIKILDWGQVYKECISYVLSLYEQNKLCRTIEDGIEIMDGDSYDLLRFDQEDLRMDSGLTKIYSIGSERSIIYDSRVTAALFLIATDLLFEDTVRDLELMHILAAGKSSSKNYPNKRGKDSAMHLLEPFCFKSNFPKQAHLNLTSNWILQEAVAKASLKSDLKLIWQSESDGLLRAIESSLFMIGADISRKFK